jgi:hypothetical protein
MKIRALLDYINAVTPHAFPEKMLMMWLNEVEGRVQLDILLASPADVKIYALPADENTELLLPFSHGAVYRAWLKAMVHRANGNTAHYENEMEVFNNAWNEYACWHAETGGR